MDAAQRPPPDERTASTASYRFGDWVSGLTQSAAGVDVQFARSGPERYDLVVGADGLHSGVRSLAFGAEERFLRHHGYRLATFSLPNLLELRRTALMYTVPGKAVMVASDRRRDSRSGT